MRTKRRKLKRKTPLVICCLLLLTVLAGCGMLFKDQLISPQEIMFNPTDPSDPTDFTSERLNVLLLGIDARQGETMARSDTVILASIDQKSKQVALLSIPRDTRVSIPGHGMDKVNSASVYGGPELAAKTVSQLLGTQIKYYVLVNFSGFKDIVDALGGVPYDVEQNMYHWDENKELVINLKKGMQRLDGDKALQYVRYREYPMGDIDRTQYQQKFLVALGKEMLQPSTIPKLPRLATEINRYVKTNLSVTDLVKLASASKNLENGNFVSQTLPGRPIEINGGSYWGVDPAEARQMLAKLFRGETETNIVLNTPLTGQYAATGGAKPVRKTGETTPAADGKTEDQKSSDRTQQDKDGTKSTGNQKTGQTGKEDKKQSGSSGSTTSGGRVVITPGSDGPGSSSVPGTKTGTGNKPGGEADPETEFDPDTKSTQSNRNMLEPEQSDTTTGTSVDEVVNPSIPGIKVKT